MIHMKNKFKAFALIELMVVLAIILILAGLFISVFNVGGGSVIDAKTKAVQILMEEGYHNITIEGYRHMAGSEDDFYKIGFTAVNAAGNVVNGVVTGDNFKGWTIRRY